MNKVCTERRTWRGIKEKQESSCFILRYLVPFLCGIRPNL